jgi:hypothetical protein
MTLFIRTAIKKAGFTSCPTGILPNMFSYTPKQKRKIPSSFFRRAHFYMRHHQIGGKESRPTRILLNMFSTKKGETVIIFFVGRISICAIIGRRERILPYENFVEHVFIRAIIRSAGRNPALREFCQICFYTCHHQIGGM